MHIDIQALRLVPGDGQRGTVFGNHVRLLHRDAAQTYSIVEYRVPSRLPKMAAHVHDMTDEAFYILEGKFGFQVGDQNFEGSAGDFVLGPRGVPHSFWNELDTASRCLILFSPAGLEQYLLELSRVLDRVGSDQEAMELERAALRERFDIRDPD